jgi:NAD(P)-dependent dehydrogenase (short-subunit alcohol dehydrogenase family)
MLLEGKVAIVSGIGPGMGRDIALALAREGADIAMGARRDRGLIKVSGEVEALGRRAVWVQTDITNREDCERLARTAREELGRVDILVNNAATNPYMGPAIDIDLARYDKTFQVNLRGTLVWTQLAHRASMAEHGGAVINLASVGGLSVEPSIGVYNTTKAAVIYLTKTLAAELGPGVRVNAIAPGLVKTDMARALWETHGEALARRLPTRRLGEPQDIADAALFLASDLSSWITGQTLVVDGGAMVAG